MTISKTTKSAICLFISLLWQTCIGLELDDASYLRFKAIHADHINSLGQIRDIAQDADGFIWLGGINGLARYDGYELRIFQSDPQDPHSISHNTINDIHLDAYQRLWIATDKHLNLYNPNTQSFTTFKLQSENVAVNTIYAIYEDVQHRFWLAAFNGLFRLTFENNERRPMTKSVTTIIGEGIIFDVAGDNEGNIWAGGSSKLGLLQVNRRDDSVTRHALSAIDGQQINQDQIRSIIVDNKNQIWFGMLKNGLFSLSPNEKQLHAHNSDDQVKGIYELKMVDTELMAMVNSDGLKLYDLTAQKTVHRFSIKQSEQNAINANTIFQDHAEEIWLGFHPAGVSKSDLSGIGFTTIPNNANNEAHLSGKSISRLIYDDDSLWVGSGSGIDKLDLKTNSVSYRAQTQHFDNGLISISQLSKSSIVYGIWSEGVKIFDPSNSSTPGIFSDEKSRKTAGQYPWSLVAKDASSVWIGSEEGLILLNVVSGQSQKIYPRKDVPHDKPVIVRDILVDSDTQFWLGTTSGLLHINLQTQSVKSYRHLIGDKKSLPNDFIFSVYRSKNGKIWLGTKRGLAVMETEDSFKTFTTAEGMPSDVVTSIAEDESGRIWVSTYDGLAYVDPATGTVASFNGKTDLTSEMFHHNTASMLPDGRLAFGNTDGIILIEPNKVRTNNLAPRIQITNIELNDIDQNIQKSIPFAENLTIPPKIKTVSIQFSALNYTHPAHNKYAYRFAGNKSHWQQLDTNNTLTFSHLEPGQYQLDIIGSNNDGVWSTNPASINLKILPPFWLSWYAYLIYIVVSVLIIYFVADYFAKHRLYQKEKQVNLNLKQADKIKDIYLANTSHELRTPLGGMIGIIQMLLKSNKDKNTQDKLLLLQSSSQRLNVLVNDILDWAKIVNGTLKLHKTVLPLSTCVEESILMLTPLAKTNNIELKNNVPKDAYIYADKNRLSQILMNLILNGIKYSDGGFVKIDYEFNLVDHKIQVSDSGVGIPAEKINAIFDRFTQADQDLKKSADGSGLGLSIVKMLVEQHEGKIEVESTVGEGSTFVVSIPATPSKIKTNFQAKIIKNSQKIAIQKALILIVDDEPINLIPLRVTLENQGHEVIECCDANIASKLISNNRDLDLVISDIQMPKKSGLDLLKDTRQLGRQLPFIFLTSQTSQSNEDMYQFVSRDDVLTKPFDEQALLDKMYDKLKREDQTY